MKKHFTSSAIVIKDNKILLLWHNKLNTWLYPGGHLEENETPDETAKREVKEETNLDIDFINTCNFKFTSDNVKVLNNPYVIMEETINDLHGQHSHIDMVYLTTPQKNNEIMIRKEESKKFGWFSHEQIRNIDMLPNLKALLLQVFSQIEKGKIIINDKEKYDDYER